MKEVYAVLSRTHTGVGKLIRFFTHYELNHSALALDSSLMRLYSFGRKANRPALAGGFIIETPGRYCPGDFDPKIKVFRFRVSDKHYEEIRARLQEMEAEKDEYLYNTYGAFLSGFGIWFKVEKAYSCIEFVTHMLGFKKPMSIRRFDKTFSHLAVYEGSYREYVKGELDNVDDFFRKKKRRERAREVRLHFKTLHARIFKRQK